MPPAPTRQPPAAAATNEFYVYVSHYKSGTGTTIEASRNGEAQIIRTNEAMDLPAGARVLYVGDFNISGSGEASYQTLLAPLAPNGVAQGQGIDPMNASGSPTINWAASTTDTNLLAQETEHSYYLEYRDDFQVMTTNVYYGTPGGMKYVPGTFHNFGNNGTTAYKGSLNSGTNTALNNRLAVGAPISAAQLYLDLTNASDHLPVVADYTLPLPAPVILVASAAGTNLTLKIANGISNEVYSVLMSTNPALASWTVAATNVTASYGTFLLTLTNAVSPAVPGRYYRLAGK